MFIDTSVIVAILSEESDADLYTLRIADSSIRLTSSVVVLEAAMRLSSKLDVAPLDVQNRIERLFESLRIEIMPIDADHARIAVQAFATYGKARGHPAQLNLADCLSYACAKSKGLPILFKGDDFSRTGMAAPPA